MYENVLYICDISNFSNLNKDYRHLFLKNLYMMLTIVYWLFTFLLLYVHFSSVKILPRYCSDFYTGFFFFSFLLGCESILLTEHSLIALRIAHIIS